MDLAEKSWRELKTLAVSSPIPSGLKMSERDERGGERGGGDTFLRGYERVHSCVLGCAAMPPVQQVHKDKDMGGGGGIKQHNHIVNNK
jgi:hypothetical protein